MTEPQAPEYDQADADAAAAAWEPPTCEHGHIVLACPKIDCVTQGQHLQGIERAMARYEETMARAAREFVRELLAESLNNSGADPTLTDELRNGGIV